MAEDIGTQAPSAESQAATTGAGQAATSKISSMLGKLQNFNVADFVKGKPGQWQKAAVAAVIVIIIMGLGAVMMWGLALWALANSFGDPSGNSAQSCFDSQFTDNWVVSGPDPSKAIKTETRTVYATAYCPPETGQDATEGGQTTASGIHVGLGSIAVPKLDHKPPINGDTSDYPWGTAFEIPGYGTGWAMDYGCAIQKAGAPGITCADGNHYPSTPNDHIDIFVGNGQDACKKWPTRTALEVKIYWFDQNEFPHSNPSRYLKATKTDTTFGGSNCPSATSNSMWNSAAEAVAAIGGFPVRGKNIVSYKFMGRNISGGVNKYIVPALDKVQAELKAKGVTYNFRDVQGYNWRHNVNSPRYISPHALGLAIDINPFNPNDNCNPRPSSCQPRDPSPSCCRHDIPQEVSETFEKYGFFWGAKFYKISDPMHFQYGGNYGTSSILWNGGNPIIVSGK